MIMKKISIGGRHSEREPVIRQIGSGEFERKETEKIHTPQRDVLEDKSLAVKTSGSKNVLEIPAPGLCPHSALHIRELKMKQARKNNNNKRTNQEYMY